MSWKMDFLCHTLKTVWTNGLFVQKFTKVSCSLYSLPQHHAYSARFVYSAGLFSPTLTEVFWKGSLISAVLRNLGHPKMQTKNSSAITHDKLVRAYNWIRYTTALRTFPKRLLHLHTILSNTYSFGNKS